MADQSILREYLISLGFKVDGDGEHKFNGTMLGFDKKAKVLGQTLIGVATAAQAMVGVFAYQMEKLYYSSKRIDSTAGNIKALEYGAEQIGVSGEQMRGSLEGMARAMRSNPGLTGLLNSLGVHVTGRDKSDVLMDLVAQLKTMPSFVAEKYAGLFGIDPDTLFMLEAGLDEMKKAAALRKQSAADLGIDTEAAAKAGKEYAQQWREILMTVGLFKDALSLAMLGPMSDMAAVTKDVLKDWIKIVQTWQGGTDFLTRMREGLTGQKPSGVVKLTPEAESRLKAGQTNLVANPVKDNPDATEPVVDKKYVPVPASDSGPAKPKEKKSMLGWLLSSPIDPDKALKFKTPTSAPTTSNEVVGKIGGLPTTNNSTTTTTNNPTTNNSTTTTTNNPTTNNSTTTTTNNPTTNNSTTNTTNNSTTEAESISKGAELFARLEKQYSLPAGLLDRIWKRESGRGKNMLSPAGAKGHFQFMDQTAKQYGVKDPNDLEQSATGAAKYLADLKQQFGDTRSATAAYNWGPGHLKQSMQVVAKQFAEVGQTLSPGELREKALGRAPKETRDYADATAGPAPTITQTNHISVSGVTDPQQAANKVEEQQRTVNADLVRNFTPRVM